MPTPKPTPRSAAADNATPVMREAIAWIVRLNSGDETAEDFAAFEAWKAASESNEAAARRAQSLLQTLHPALSSYGGRRRRMTSLALLLFAGLALALAAQRAMPLAQYVADHRTGTGEVRTDVLKDGSVVDIDSGTSFDVSADGRTLRLHTGQVFVKVAPDPARPFRVVTDRAETRALGTAFAVRLQPESERIAVTEHAVRVTQDPQSPGIDVSEGQVIEIGAGGAVQPAKADVEAMLAWRQGAMHFRERPFGEVIAELERYRRGRVVIADDAIARLAITGSFDVNDTDAFLNAAALALPVRMVKAPGLVVVWRDSSRPLSSR